MPSPMVDTTCATCGAPRRCRKCLLDTHTICSLCQKTVAARTKRKLDGRSSQYKGVVYSATKYAPGRPWLARLRVDGRLIYLGRFAEEDDAGDACERWRQVYWPEQNN